MNMEFKMNEWKEKVVSAGKTAANKSGELVEIAKLSLQISSKEDDIAKVYREIGESVYDAFKNADVNVEVEPRCEKLDVLFAELEELKNRRAQLRDEHACPGCGKMVKEGHAFCHHCGKAQ